MEKIKNPTLFVDIDGTIIKYRQFANLINTEPEPIQDVIDFVNKEYDNGAVIIVTTARPSELELFTKQDLEKINLKYHQIVFDCGRGTRLLLNDRDPEYPDTDRAVGINFNRDEGFTDENAIGILF
jgi:histidinol phosphatase-like enzyme